MSAALLLMIAVPAAGAVLAGALGRGRSRVVAVGAAAVTAALAVWSVRAGFGGVFRASAGTLPWLAGEVRGPLFGVLLDPLGSVMLLVATLIGLLTVLYSAAYMSTRNRDHAVGAAEQGPYYFRLLLFLASMVGVALAPNFLQLFVFWELTTVCSWSLIAFYGDAKSLRAGFKALLVTHIGGLFFLAALLVLFTKTRSFEFDALAQLPGSWRGWVFAFLMIAAWAKAAQVPFHTWLPDAMAAPTPISAYLHAAAMVKAGVFLMARAASAGWAMPPRLAMLLGAMALVTMFVALSYYFVQDDLKRLLAYSTIAHLGYVLLGVALGALGSTTGFRAGVLHIACHGFSKATLFLCAGAIAYVTGSRSIAALGGLARTMPLTAVAFFVGVLSVTGVPPFACFWSKFMLLAGAIALGGAVGPVLLALVLIESLISFGWMVRVGQKIFLGPVTPVAAVHSDPPWPMSAALVLLMIGCLAIPAAVMPLVELIGR
jgi:hydrogenase-4 component D